MPYASGTANSFNDLLAALRAACTSNGWTLSGEVLSKAGCFVQTRVGENGQSGSPAPPANSMLIVRSGLGVDGANQLTGASTVALGGPRVGLLQAATGTTWPEWDWPVAYHIHVNASPDEVCLAVSYGGGQFFQHLMFGRSPGPGNAGTGNWHFGTVPEIGTLTNFSRRVNNASIAPNGANLNTPNGQAFCPAPWWPTGRSIGVNNTEACMNAQVHGAIDSVTGLPIWSNKNFPYNAPAGIEGAVSASLAAVPLLGYSPNAWNNETHLVPIQVIQARPSAKSSLIAELQHVRMCRNDFIDGGAIITLGTDKWKVYPCYRKNTDVRDGVSSGVGSDHSGTIAFAIRYDGP